MKKNTQNQIVTSKNNFISAQKSLLLSIKRVSFILVFFTSIVFGQSNNCKANLIVEDNGYIRSTPLEGTYYSMIITNTGNSSDTYSLSSSNINSSCTNNDGTSTASNVVVNTDFIDPNRNPITEITVNSGESVNFYVHITVPIGTPINKWSCTQIIAESKTCTNYKVDSVLHTFVINPSKD
jgi:hypothetical protein